MCIRDRYMDFIMRIYLERCKASGIKFLKLRFNIPSSVSSTGRISKGEYDLDWTGYADDLMITFDDKDSLQRGITILDELFAQYGMKINVTKTKTMIFNQQITNDQEYPTTIASLGGKALENVKVFRYLGCDIKFDESSTGEAELNLRTDAATSKFYSLSRNMMNNKTHLKTRVMMLNSLVRSRLTYGCQTWSCNKNQMNKLNAAYMGFIRRMVRGGFKRRDGSWSYCYTNNDLLRISNTTNILTFVEKQQANYVVNILMKTNDSIVKRLMLNDDARRKPGRQTTLLSSVLNATNCSLEDFIVNNVAHEL